MRRFDTALVSVVTPTLQRADLLERTLRSVRAQTHPNVEHIVVDGGSTDRTVAILKRYSGTYNLRWISESDHGMYDAVNKGLRMAKGEIVAYLNSDDLYLPWSVEVAVEAFRRHPEADAIYGDAIRVDEIRQWIVPVFTPPFSAAAMAAYGTLLQPSVFLRRRVVDALGGFDETFAYVADLEFWLRAARRFRFIHVSEFLAVDRRHAAMLSETRRGEMAAEDHRMRSMYRRGFASTELGRVVAHARWHWWSGRRWLALVMATRNLAGGWVRTIDACHPSVDAWSAAKGLIPSRASRFRSTIRWRCDPLTVASPEPADSKRSILPTRRESPAG